MEVSEYILLSPSSTRNMIARWQQLALLHTFIIGPLFVALGEYGRMLPKAAFPAIAMVGIIVELFHTYRYFTNGMRNINLFHMLIVAPVLIYIGVRGKAHAGFALTLATMMGFAAIGYHASNLIKYSIM